MTPSFFRFFFFLTNSLPIYLRTQQIVSLTIVTASKGVLYCSAEVNPDILKAASCGLGALGIITNVTIQCENTFLLESIQTPEKLGKILNTLNEIIYSAEHVRIWWFPHTDDCIVWRANRTNKVGKIFFEG